jgi:hypothetical protein
MKLMNRIGCLIITALLLVIPLNVWGTGSSGISENSVKITIRNIDKLGWRVGGEYGVLDNLALTADLGEHDYSRFGVKLPVTPTFSFLGGFRNSDVFLGADLRTELTDKIMGMSQIDIYKSDHNLRADYEIGAQINMMEQLEFQLGFAGEMNESGMTYNVMLGLAYSF